MADNQAAPAPKSSLKSSKPDIASFAGLVIAFAGIIGGQDPSGQYIGIAPKATILSVKLSDDTGGAYESDVLRGLRSPSQAAFAASQARGAMVVPWCRNDNRARAASTYDWLLAIGRAPVKPSVKQR